MSRIRALCKACLKLVTDELSGRTFLWYPSSTQADFWLCELPIRDSLRKCELSLKPNPRDTE